MLRISLESFAIASSHLKHLMTFAYDNSQPLSNKLVGPV
jgi:hypothetical protein